MSQTRESPAQRFQAALALFDLSVSMMRQRLRRQMPAAADEAIDKLVVAWIQDRRGAPEGDCPGRVRAWPRS